MSRTAHPAGRYDAVARTLHWAMAALILANLPLGLLHDALKPINVMPLHKSLGLTVLLLAVLRIVWRLTHPALPLQLGAAERTAAATVQGLLYLLMLCMPLTGWATASAGKFPLRYFGLFAWPKLPATLVGTTGSAPYHLMHQSHALGGWLMLALLAGHIGAALWHHFRLRDGMLQRMI